MTVVTQVTDSYSANYFIYNFIAFHALFFKAFNVHALLLVF